MLKRINFDHNWNEEKTAKNIAERMAVSFFENYRKTFIYVPYYKMYTTVWQEIIYRCGARS